MAVSVFLLLNGFSYLVLISFIFSLQCRALDARLSWLLVSFWAHVNIVASYRNTLCMLLTSWISWRRKWNKFKSRRGQSLTCLQWHEKCQLFIVLSASAWYCDTRHTVTSQRLLRGCQIVVMERQKCNVNTDWTLINLLNGNPECNSG